MKIQTLLALLALMLVGLTGCKSSPVELPLAEGKATFLFFYTDG